MAGSDHTVKKHLEKELQVRARGLKVLSLFFIDRVANYRDYGADGQPAKGKFAEFFEATLAELARDERYRELDWLKQPVGRLHDGYFAQDRKGVLKDTRGDTQADDEVYNLIMKDKEQLLSLDEPLRFIFSHSALREGWDNPNVFQICTLNETRSAFKKRQEIGRGLRLPVDQNGVRVFDGSVNTLYVMANESYEDFARALQTEYEEECGVTFGRFRSPPRQCPHSGRWSSHWAHAATSRVAVSQKFDADGRIQRLRPQAQGLHLELPGPARPRPAVVDLFQLPDRRHIRKSGTRANR
jgi:type III restriction enzyme